MGEEHATEWVKLRWDGETALLQFDRPPANAIDLGFVRAFDARLATLEQAPPAGGVVITGNGSVFSAGVDFKAAPLYDAADKAEMVATISRALARLYTLPVPTVAAVNGHAIGGGLVVAIACDYRIFAVGPARFGLTEVSAGIPYPAGPMVIVKTELEPSLRRRLVLTGEVFGSEEARQYGIADQLCESAALLQQASAEAKKLANLASYAQVKEQLKRESIAALRGIVASKSDPLLEHWI